MLRTENFERAPHVLNTQRLNLMKAAKEGREEDSPWLRGVLLQHGLHGLQLHEVLAHVRVQDHLNAEGAELPELAPRHVGEDVAVVRLDGPVSRRMSRLGLGPFRFLGFENLFFFFPFLAIESRKRIDSLQ